MAGSSLGLHMTETLVYYTHPFPSQSRTDAETDTVTEDVIHGV